MKELSIELQGKSYLNWDYDDLVSELGQDVVNNELTNIFKKQMLDSRRIAYVKESDPLYMEWQFDKTPESESRWRDKVIQIKTRYPLLTET